MNIAIIGFGKMGKTIEELALLNGHSVVERFDAGETGKVLNLNPSQVDVAIEFSQPDSAFENIMNGLSAGIPVISGTTGWLEKWREVVDHCKEVDGTFFYASNFSIGVNILFRINKQLAAIMNGQENYNSSMTEIHHTQKKDSPSGTAITLATDMLDEIRRLKEYVNQPSGDSDVIGIESIREGAVPGTHIVTYSSDLDKIEIKHEAFDRKVFAQGVIRVMEWIKGRKGVLGMDDFLSF